MRNEQFAVMIDNNVVEFFVTSSLLQARLMCQACGDGSEVVIVGSSEVLDTTSVFVGRCDETSDNLVDFCQAYDSYLYDVQWERDIQVPELHWEMQQGSYRDKVALFITREG